MKQRLGIAAAVMEDPDIVILDEPINALDERGAICIIACHDSEELEYLSDEIIQIQDGEIVS